MSILDGLVRRDWDGFPSEDGTVVAWDDVREALTNPTNEQVWAVAEALHREDQKRAAEHGPGKGAAGLYERESFGAMSIAYQALRLQDARVALAAAAGGDQ